MTNTRNIATAHTLHTASSVRVLMHGHARIRALQRRFYRSLAALSGFASTISCSPLVLGRKRKESPANLARRHAAIPINRARAIFIEPPLGPNRSPFSRDIYVTANQGV